MSRIQECQRNEKLLQTVQVIRGYNIVDPLAKCSGYNTIPGEIIGSEMPVHKTEKLCKLYRSAVDYVGPSCQMLRMQDLHWSSHHWMDSVNFGGVAAVEQGRA